MLQHRGKFMVVLSIILGILLVSILLFFNFRQSKSGSQTNSSAIKVLVTLLPQKEFVQAIGGELATVTVLVPPGYNPESFEPTPAELKAVAEADIYFLAGHLPFEQQYLEKFLTINPALKIVDLSAELPIKTTEAHRHSEDDEEDSSLENHTGIDPHTWMSTRMVRQQLPHIENELSIFFPDQAEKLAANRQSYDQLLAEVDKKLTSQFAAFAGRTILVYHPAFGYLLADYNIRQEYIEIDGKEPSVTQVQKIISEAKADGIKVIFVQQQFSQDVARAIANDIGGSVVAIDDLAPNYIENLNYIGSQISATLTKGADSDAN